MRRWDSDSAAAHRSRTTYTAYTSPNNGFTTVKEIMFKLAVDDSSKLGKAAVKPYIAIAREFDTDIARGQADGGDNAGTYLEIGFAPGYSASKASIAFPIKVGLSVGDYYELAGEDNKFGFFSIAGIVTVPLGGTTSYGAWNIHGGVEYQKLGTTTEALQRRVKANQVIGSFGFGFSLLEPAPARVIGRRRVQREHAAEQEVGCRQCMVTSLCCWRCSSAVWVGSRRIARVGAGLGSRSESRKRDAHGWNRFPERVSVPRDSTGRHRRHHVAVRRSWYRAAFR